MDQPEHCIALCRDGSGPCQGKVEAGNWCRQHNRVPITPFTPLFLRACNNTLYHAQDRLKDHSHYKSKQRSLAEDPDDNIFYTNIEKIDASDSLCTLRLWNDRLRDKLRDLIP
jgi:hypothetical protein